jgi:hypothetical protein
MNDDRISRLSKRFSTHAVGRPAASSRSRARHTFYLDTDLVTRLDTLYREINHELYPRQVSKSVFLETLIEYGLDHIAELKVAISQTAEPTPSTDK